MSRIRSWAEFWSKDTPCPPITDTAGVGLALALLVVCWPLVVVRWIGGRL